MFGLVIVGILLSILGMAAGCSNVTSDKNLKGFAVCLCAVSGALLLALGSCLMGQGRPLDKGELDNQEVYEVGEVMALNGQTVTSLRSRDDDEFFVYRIAAPVGAKYVQAHVVDRWSATLSPFPPTSQPR